MPTQTEHSAPAIIVKNAYLAYRGVELFSDLQLTLLAGKTTCLLGPSGVGKSTLLRLIAGLITPEVAAREHIALRADIISNDQQPDLFRKISYMAQTDLLMPWLSVLENVLLGTRLRAKTFDRKILITEAKALLHSVGLSNAIHLFPRELSGGMRQRVALARTLFENRAIVLMDEPFSSLDTITRYKLQTLSAELLKNKTTLLITHDPMEALRMADEIVIMSGKPAKLHKPFSLSFPVPRDIASREILELQAKLMHELTHSSQVLL